MLNHTIITCATAAHLNLDSTLAGECTTFTNLRHLSFAHCFGYNENKLMSMVWIATPAN